MTKVQHHGLTHECNDPECHVPGFITTLGMTAGYLSPAEVEAEVAAGRAEALRDAADDFMAQSALWEVDGAEAVSDWLHDRARADSIATTEEDETCNLLLSDGSHCARPAGHGIAGPHYNAETIASYTAQGIEIRDVERPAADGLEAGLRELVDEFSGSALGTDFLGNVLTDWVPVARLRALLPGGINDRPDQEDR